MPPDPGDELRLAPDATFSGQLRPAGDRGRPRSLRSARICRMRRCRRRNQRVTPATALRFAKIVSPNTAAALRTAPGAHHWRVMFLEFPSTKDGYGDIIQLGDGSSAQTQTRAGAVRDRARPRLHSRPPALRAEARHRAQRAHGDDPQLVRRPTSRRWARTRRRSAAGTAPDRSRSRTTISRRRARSFCSAAPIPRSRTW